MSVLMNLVISWRMRLAVAMVTIVFCRSTQGFFPSDYLGLIVRDGIGATHTSITKDALSIELTTLYSGPWWTYDPGILSGIDQIVDANKQMDTLRNQKSYYHFDGENF